MIITFQEILSKKEWIHKELLNSVTDEVLNKAAKDQFYDVKLLVNGIELEPRFYNDILNNIEKYIDQEAKNIINEKLEIADNKTRKLQEIIEETIEKIRDEFE